MAAGISTPPNAANKGNSALRGSRSSPCTMWRLISSPTTKKKIVIRPSFTIRWPTSPARVNPPTDTDTAVFHRPANQYEAGEFARIRATAVHASSTTPLAASMCMNRCTGASQRSTGTAGSDAGRAEPESVMKISRNHVGTRRPGGL